MALVSQQCVLLNDIQTRATAIVATTLSSLVFGLVIMSSWFTWELLHTRHQDRVWTMAYIKRTILAVLTLQQWRRKFYSFQRE